MVGLSRTSMQEDSIACVFSKLSEDHLPALVLCLCITNRPIMGWRKELEKQASDLQAGEKRT